jgi:uncharacterized membrane protein YeaQ/YmgE (transglycosylase-associated protein family)
MFLSGALGFATIIICQLLPSRWMWIGAVCGFLAGFLFSFDNSGGLLRGILLSGISGIVFASVMVISGLITKYYAKKGRNKIEKNKQ